MISKELLSLILEIDVAKIIEDNKNIIVYERDFKYPMSYNASAYLTINIHELAHMCKEYITKNYGYCIESGCFLYDTAFMYSCSVTTTNIPECDIYETGASEPEAIFKACEYILKDQK